MPACFLPHCDVLAGQVSSGDPQLSVPRPKRDVSVWDPDSMCLQEQYVIDVLGGSLSQFTLFPMVDYHQ